MPFERFGVFTPVEFKDVQDVCHRVADERDPKKATRLISELRQLLHDQVEEARITLRVISKRMRKLDTELYLDLLEHQETENDVQSRKDAA